MDFVIRAKQEKIERYSARKLERMIWQYQSSQGLTPEQISEIQQIERDDPVLFDELASKKKWTYACKNSTRALKDQHLNNAYWNLLNHVSKDKVSSVVTKRILEMDKTSCDGLLNAII